MATALRTSKMPLRIDIKAGEKFILNNTLMHLTKSSGIIIESKATFLRDRDRIGAEDVNTPGKAIYYFCQQMYLHEDQYEAFYEQFRLACMVFAQAAPSFGPLLLNLSAHVARRELFVALKRARRLVEMEGGLIHQKNPEEVERIFMKLHAGSMHSELNPADSTEKLAEKCA